VEKYSEFMLAAQGALREPPEKAKPMLPLPKPRPNRTRLPASPSPLRTTPLSAPPPVFPAQRIFYRSRVSCLPNADQPKNIEEFMRKNHR
jgi:hypothetical protein